MSLMSLNYSKIKSLYKNLPLEFKYLLYFLPFSVFCGSVYRKQYQELEKQVSYQAKDIEKIRNRRLISYVNDAIKYTSYYSDVAKKLNIDKIEDIDQFFEFPVLDKEELQSDLSRFLDRRFERRRYSVTTGGTSGKQTMLYLSNNCYSSEWAFVNHYLSQNNVNINSRRLCLRGVDGIPPDKLLGNNPLYKELLLSPFRLNEENILESIETIKKFNARWIHGYPSSVRDFAGILDKLDLKLGDIKHILLVSEKALPEQVEYIKSVFNAKVLSFYGMTERVIFAPLVGTKYIPNQLYGVTEEIDGELIGTGFLNSATRLIRYKTGDMAEVIKKDNFVTQIENLTGRWGKEYLLGFTGVKVTMTALNTHSDVLYKVKKYQFRQTQIGLCDLILEVYDGFNVDDKEKVELLFQEKVGRELEIKCRIVDTIPLTKRGKHQFIFSTLN